MKNRIQQLRLEKKITQVRLSIELEVSQETISAYELGKHLPSLTNMIKLSTLFDVSIDYILCRSDARHPMAKDLFSIPELELYSCFRLMNQVQKEKVISYAQGILDAAIPLSSEF